MAKERAQRAKATKRQYGKRRTRELPSPALKARPSAPAESYYALVQCKRPACALWRSWIRHELGTKRRGRCNQCGQWQTCRWSERVRFMAHRWNRRDLTALATRLNFWTQRKWNYNNGQRDADDDPIDPGRYPLWQLVTGLWAPARLDDDDAWVAYMANPENWIPDEESTWREAMGAHAANLPPLRYEPPNERRELHAVHVKKHEIRRSHELELVQ